MSWLDVAVPARMKRVALVAAEESLRDVLVRVADAAAVEIGSRAARQAPRCRAAGRPGGAARRRAGCSTPAVRWPVPCCPSPT